MSKLTLAGMLTVALAMIGCDNNAPPPAPVPAPVPPPTKSVDVQAPGVDVKVDRDGVDVKAPGADVQVDKK